MSNPEIERTLKKVTEGLEIFHETLEKLESAATPAQKEKIEVELKKEIKKLQRLRDQIKTWQTLSELKDKQAINEARRSIELEMERFKVLEKEMKIKAYSKEGLSQAAKLDPREQDKLKVAHWINSAVDRLGTQTDALEAELEALQIQSRKTKRIDGEKQSRLDELPEVIERHKTHVRKLEKLLRLMENDKYEPEDVNSIKDDVEYYVDSNQEADFVPDDQLYDQFELINDNSSDEDSSDFSDDEDGERSRDLSNKSDSKKTEPSSPPRILAKKKSLPNLVVEQPKSLAASVPTAGAGAVSAAAIATTTANVVAAATNTTTTTTTLSSATTIKKSTSSLPSATSANLLSGMSNAKTASALPNSFPLPSSAASAALGSVPMPVVLPSTSVPTAPAVVPKVTGPSFASAISASTTTSATSSAATTPSTNVQSPAAKVNAASSLGLNKSSSSPSSPPPSSAHRLSTTERPAVQLPGPYEELYAVIQRNHAHEREKTQAELLTILESSYQHCPDGGEIELGRLFTPKQPFSTPAYYPSHLPHILENPAIFERFELDTLFFIFYYQQKTYAQYLAARELKRQSWRFHKKYLTWFQRHEEPKTITEEYEQGTYIYFDYEGNWCQRKKSEFTFEYRYLEDEETV